MVLTKKGLELKNKATASRSLALPKFLTKDGDAVDLAGYTSDATPFERFTKNPPGGWTRIGAQESTFLMCPKSSWADAEKAGVDMEDLKAILTWAKKRKGPTTHVFHATAGPEQSVIWIQDKDMGIDPEDYVCTPFEGMLKK